MHRKPYLQKFMLGKNMTRRIFLLSALLLILITTTCLVYWQWDNDVPINDDRSREIAHAYFETYLDDFDREASDFGEVIIHRYPDGREYIYPLRTRPDFALRIFVRRNGTADYSEAAPNEL